MKLNCRSSAKFDAIVAKVRRDMPYPFEFALAPPHRWGEQAILFDEEKQLIVRAGPDAEVLVDYPYQQVALGDLIVTAEDADFPLDADGHLRFGEAVRSAAEEFERQYGGREWHPRVARLILESKFHSPAEANDATRRDILAPLREVLEAELILPPLQEPVDLETVDPVFRETELSRSLWFCAELQLARPLPEEEAVRRIQGLKYQCPADFISPRVRWIEAGPSEHPIGFRARQF